MQNFLASLIGKTIRLLLRFRRNGGQALPGLVIEKIFPNYVRSQLAKLPDGVVIITGTNGKTTTTKIVVHMLRANGKKVLTNSTGSNLVRGIASSIAHHADFFGGLKEDIAVLEVDEATARALVEQINPRWVLGLNVSRDQLDRFGEVDTVAKYVGEAMKAATEGIVANANDPHLKPIAEGLANIDTSYFGFADKLSQFFPSDYEIAAVSKPVKSREKSLITDVGVELADFKGQVVVYKINGKDYKAKLKLSGQHNFLNGAAALALCQKLLPNISAAELVIELSQVDLAFGRGEKYRLKNGTEIELVLVKNPASFTQALASYGSEKANLMIAINDNIADGRDVSWLWDVNFSPLKDQDVAISGGRRAADMALRLSYDDIKVAEVVPDLTRALEQLSHQNGPKVILATYTAMLNLYSLLSKQGVKLP